MKISQTKDADIINDWVPSEVHNWDGKESNVLVLNYTMQCPLACDFCCYNCHSKREEKMPVDLARYLINQAGKLGVFSSVGFTGGEPLLHYNEIMKLGDDLLANKLPFTIATAGHWATSYGTALEILKNLKSIGLIRLNISHDPSHAKFVSSELILHAAKAGSYLKIPTYIVGTFFDPLNKLENYIPSLVGIDYVKLYNKYVAKVGRAIKHKINQATYNLDLEMESLSCYRRIHHDIAVFWDGNTYPCCSTFNRITKGIKLGNANKESLESIFHKAEGSLKLRIMKRQSFAELYKIIKQRKPQLFERLPNQKEFVGPCSLCNAIFSDEILTKEINELFELYEIEKVNDVINIIYSMIGEESTLELLNSSC